jgi:hypothetical protein
VAAQADVSEPTLRELLRDGVFRNTTTRDKIIDWLEVNRSLYTFATPRSKKKHAHTEVSK